MSYPIKAHTLPLLEKILGTAGLADQVKAFIDSRSSKTDHFHEYLVNLYEGSKNNLSALGLLYNFIYSQLGTSGCAQYAATPVAQDVVDEYITAFRETGKWNTVGFQSQPGYLICLSATPAEERMILNFKTQPDALAFAGKLRDIADKSVSFKILLGSPLEAIDKNDKIVIYYPKAQRSAVLTIISGIPDAQLAPQVSGFYLKVKNGVGIAAETEPTWSFTMFTAEYCMEYLVNQTRDGKPYAAAEMYAYVVKRLTKPEHPHLPMDLYAAE